MKTLLFRKQLASLAPVDDEAEAALSKIPQGDIVRVAGLNRPRNPQHHRLFWKLLGLVAENSDDFADARQLHFYLKVKTGYVREYITKDGEILLEPEPTDYASMDQIAFAEHFDKCVAIVCAEIIPGLKSEALRKEIEDMLA